MTATKHVKMLRNGQDYWLFWHWDSIWTPDTHPADEQLPQLSGRYLYASGPFRSAADAKKAISDDWTLMSERVEVVMDDKANRDQLILTLARLTVDLALENEYYKRQMGEIGNFRQLPETLKRLREFQPPLDALGTSADDKQAADAVQGILDAIRHLLQ